MDDSKRRVSRIGARALVGAAGVLALVLSPTSEDPRWQKSIEVLFAGAMLSASVSPRRHWRTLQGVVAGAAALLLSVSGVVSGMSPDEGVGLIAGAFLLSGLAWFLGGPERRTAEWRAKETLAELSALRRGVETLIETAAVLPRGEPRGQAPRRE